MSNLQSLHEDRVLFGTEVPPAVNVRLQAAVAAYNETEKSERLLWEALRAEPGQLETYVALYKFYFYKYRLDEAQCVTLMALNVAAAQGGFEADWSQLRPDSAAWGHSDGPERYYLYSLKALGFIRLRKGDVQEGENILFKLRELDPEDRVGGSVLLDLLAALTGDE